MKKKILLVDDSRPMLALLYGLLKTNYEVQCSTDAQTGLEILKSFKPDLIISDLNMPEMNGVEFITKIKQDPQLNHISVIVLSGLQDSTERLKLYKIGVDDYITKPFSPEEMIIRIDKIVSSKKFRIVV